MDMSTPSTRGRAPPHPGLRQFPQRCPRTRRHRHSVSSAAARTRRPLSLCAPACMLGRANAKGKIERQILYLRQAFFAARTFSDVDDLNAQFRRWRDDIAHHRRHPEHPDHTVAESSAAEQPRLLPLPAHPFETDVMRMVLRQDPVRALRPQQLLDPAHACAAPADAAREPDHRAHARRHRGDRAPRPQLRHRAGHRAGGPCRRPRRGDAPSQSVECA